MQATLRKPLCVFLGSFLVCQRLVTPGGVTRQSSENDRADSGLVSECWAGESSVTPLQISGDTTLEGDQELSAP